MPIYRAEFAPISISLMSYSRMTELFANIQPAGEFAHHLGATFESTVRPASLKRRRRELEKPPYTDPIQRCSMREVVNIET